MTTVMIVFLFILQMVSFFLIVLLFMKMNRFNELKRQQDVMMREMEDAVGAYLAEIKDENDRLLKELSSLASVNVNEKTAMKEEPQVAANPVPQMDTVPVVPKSKAVATYKQVAKPKKEEKELSVEEKALEMRKNGYSIDEIAKSLKMGKTEVELLLKFRR